MLEKDSRLAAETHAAAHVAHQSTFDGVVDTTGFIDGPPPERFERALRQCTYEAMQLTTIQVEELETMVAGAPARVVGKGAIDNLITLFPSRKNGGQRWLESHTVERLFAYRLERDPNVTGYVTQVQCRRVVRLREGRRHVSTACLDFLVFYRDAIALVECKTEERLEALARRKPDEWNCDAGRWSNAAYASFAAVLGIGHQVYASSRLFSVELQNAELIYDESDSATSFNDKSLRRAAVVAISKGPLTIDGIAAYVPGFNVRIAAAMLARQEAYGLERTHALSETDKFLLFSDRAQRDAIEEQCWSQALAETDEIDVSARLLLATPSQVAHARARLERLRAIKAGRAPRTARMDRLQRRVNGDVRRGLSPLEACLTDHDKCGNREPRLLDKQERALQVVLKLWEKGQLPDRSEAMMRLEALCKKSDVGPPHPSTLNRHIALLNPNRRTLVVDGVRQYQKDRDRMDGSRQSEPSHEFGHTLIVDSSNFDRRVGKDLLDFLGAAVPRFYVGIDAPTRYPMAHALMFGPARTDGLAILIRQFVHRHGFLPRIIQLDRGSENRSGWLKEFAAIYGIEIRLAPTGGSRWDGIAENAIGRVNHAVAHKGPGSTFPDQRGRAVDGRIKSRKTACQSFGEMLGEFETFLYDVFPHIRDDQNLSPHDRREFLLETIGLPPTKCELNGSFHIATSLRVPVPRTVAASRGIRLTEGVYSGGALASALRTGRVEEIRKDCVHPSLIFVKVSRMWYRALRRDCRVLFARGKAAQLFHMLNEPSWRSERAAHNFDLKRRQHEARHAQMTAALPGKDHLVLAADNASPIENDMPSNSYPALDWASIAPCPTE